jgi:hypothetical protein
MSHSDSISVRVGQLTVTSGSVDVGNTSTVQVFTTPAPVALGNATATLTTAQVFSGMGTSTPGAAATFTTPTAAALVAYQADTQVGDSFDLVVINLSGSNAITMAAGTGVTLVGAAGVAVSTSASFRVRFTNVTASSEAVSVYRISA